MPTRAPTVLDRMLDATVVSSFDRRGYRRHARRFDPADGVPWPGGPALAAPLDLAGRHIWITGANAGLGLAMSRALGGLGATVVMLCRSPERGQRARDELVAELSGQVGQAEAERRFLLRLVDMADRAAIDRIIEEQPELPIHALVHNAGALVHEWRLIDGWAGGPLELTVASQLVGPWHLTQGLLSRLGQPVGTPPGRLIWMASGGMYPRPLSVANLARTSGKFDGVTAYADVKRAQVVLNEATAASLAEHNISTFCMHPGWADTGGVKKSLPTFRRWTARILRDGPQGADTGVWLAACPWVGSETGRFWFDREEVSAWLPWQSRPGQAQVEGLLSFLQARCAAPPPADRPAAAAL